LIASLLTPEELEKLLHVGEELGMDALVEIHTDEDLKKAVNAGASILGINNRNLRTLSVEPARAKQLIPHIPKGATIVVESGLSRHEELMEYKSLGVNAFLVGTALMKSSDIVGKMNELLGRDKKWRKHVEAQNDKG
jgi:indole-3-glycerol phosphate synthase